MPKTYETLFVLVENSGRMLSKHELMKARWPDSFVEESNLAVQISTIRKALGELPGEHRYISKTAESLGDATGSGFQASRRSEPLARQNTLESTSSVKRVATLARRGLTWRSKYKASCSLGPAARES